MSISKLYDKTVTTRRLGKVAGSLKEVWADNLTGLACAIHPQGQEQRELHGDAYYKLFKMWCALDSDVLVGDRIVEGEKVYVVRGTSKYDFLTRQNQHHLSVTLALV